MRDEEYTENEASELDDDGLQQDDAQESAEESATEEAGSPEKFHFSFKQLIDGRVFDMEFFHSNHYYLIMLTVIGIVYISIGYYAEGLYKTKDSLEQQVKELRFESITTASNLMKMSLQSEVKKQIEHKGLNLRESKEPPIRIEK